jgi:hypothetical protein
MCHTPRQWCFSEPLASCCATSVYSKLTLYEPWFPWQPLVSRPFSDYFAPDPVFLVAIGQWRYGLMPDDIRACLRILGNQCRCRNNDDSLISNTSAGVPTWRALMLAAGRTIAHKLT